MKERGATVGRLSNFGRNFAMTDGWKGCDHLSFLRLHRGLCYTSGLTTEVPAPFHFCSANMNIFGSFIRGLNDMISERRGGALRRR